MARMAGLCGFGLVACGGGAADDLNHLELASAGDQAASIHGLALSGTATVTSMNPDGWVFMDSTLTLRNLTGQKLHLNRSLSLVATQGGFAFSAGDAIADSGSFFGIGPDLTAGSIPQNAGPWSWNWSIPVVHEIQRVEGATRFGQSVVGMVSIPITRSGYATPGPSPYTDDVVATLQLPLEVLPLTSGERWLGVTGQIVDMTRTEPSVFPSLAATVRDTRGAAIATLPISDLEFPPDSTHPFWFFLAAGSLPSGAVAAAFDIDASLQTATGTVPVHRRVPVTTAAAISLAPPLSGRWYWHNGPGQTYPNPHSGFPEQRYAYDLKILKTINGTVTSYFGDPTVNESYFAFGKPIRAARAGTVVRVIDDSPDNSGDQGNINGNPNNSVILQHTGGLFTIYTHLRQGSATVAAGQSVRAGAVLGQVGNAGDSSEPHLHFAVYRLDGTGRVTALPMAPTGLRSTGGALLSGVPKTDAEYLSP